MKKTYWGFDVRDMDLSVRPQDDFFHYANGTWLKKNTIPADEARWGSFDTLRFETQKQLHTLVTALLDKKAAPGTPEQQVRDLYLSAMDMTTRNELGAKPLEPLRKKIASIKSSEDLLSVIAHLHRLGLDVVWGGGIDQDSKNSEKYMLHLAQDGLGLPDRDYYLKNDAESVRIRDAYVVFMRRLFILAGKTKAEAEEAIQTVMGIETKLAKASMDKVDTRDVDKTYHKKTLAQLQRLTPSIDWKRYFKLTDVDGLSEVIVMTPDFFVEADKMLSSLLLEEWKIYLEWHVIAGSAGSLSMPFMKASFDFYGVALTGRKKMKPMWRQALGAVNGGLGETLGQLYVAKHFTKEKKQKMDELVDDLFTAYEARIKNLDWMTPATKKKALAKLAMITRKIGYPKKWKSYRGLKIVANDFYGNAERAAEFEHKRAMKKLRGPVDRDEWHMSPQTVNAYCNYNLNEIVFPAAILQFPFFDFDADDAINYGAIGYVIGHEITHALDDQGAKFDGKGNRKNWWTDEDLKQFEERGALVAKQFDQYEVADGLHVNGKLTLGENIADLGGFSIAYDAYQLKLARTGRRDIDGFTPEQRFFLGGAQEERELCRPEFEKMQVLTDPHSPCIFRMNGPASNMPEFYEAFGVQKGDKLYREPSKRAKVW